MVDDRQSVNFGSNYGPSGSPNESVDDRVSYVAGELEFVRQVQRESDNDNLSNPRYGGLNLTGNSGAGELFDIADLRQWRLHRWSSARRRCTKGTGARPIDPFRGHCLPHWRADSIRTGGGESRIVNSRR